MNTHTIFILTLLSAIYQTGLTQSKEPLYGIWLCETFDGYISLLNIKEDNHLTMGYIQNKSGSLAMETEDGVWQLKQNQLELQLNAITLDLNITNFNNDSVIFDALQNTDIKIRKIVRTTAPQNQEPIALIQLLTHNTFKDNEGNKYQFANTNNWCLFNFNGLVFCTNEYCWFKHRIVYQLNQLNKKTINFRYYHNGLHQHLNLMYCNKENN